MRDTLRAIAERKDGLNLVITDIDESNENGCKMVQYIEKKLQLAVISFPPYDNTKLVSSAFTNGAKLYFVKSLRVEEFKNLWQYAYATERGKLVNARENVVEASLGMQQFQDLTQNLQKDNNRRQPKETREQNDEARDHSPNEKKQRIVWANWMHKKFLEAIEQLGGPDMAFPKKILEVMDVPGLTRESVASHLQKYRMGIKRRMDPTSSLGRINLGTSCKQTCFPSSYSALNFISSQGSYQPGSCCDISMPSSSNYSCSFHSDSSSTISTSNLGRLAPTSNNLSIPSLESIVQKNKNLLDFRPLEPASQTGLVPVDSEYVPFGQVNQDCGTTNILSTSTYVGYRLVSNGKLVEFGQKSFLENDERTDEFSLSVLGGKNESLVQYPSPSFDYIPQQLASPPPTFPATIPHDLDLDRGAEFGNFDYAFFNQTITELPFAGSNEAEIDLWSNFEADPASDCCPGDLELE
ncbi:hypothetical protein U1Q18_034851 [Sarracenia purpurea var. burkii]